MDQGGRQLDPLLVPVRQLLQGIPDPVGESQFLQPPLRQPRPASERWSCRGSVPDK